MATRAVSFDDGIRRSFEEEWPELARRLERFLAAKGVELWLRGDVVQETGARVYRRWSKLDHSRPLWNLVVTIALGILVDERRKASRVEPFSDVPQSDVNDVETRALHRVHLAKTRAALTQLRADQRRVLLAEVGEASVPAGTRNRINVLRLRARASLREALGPWAPAGVALRIQSFRTAIQRRAAEWGHAGAAATTSIAGFAAAATLVLGGAAIDAGSPSQKLRAQDPQTTRVVNLYSAFSKMQGFEPPKPESKAKVGTKRRADGRSGFVGDANRLVQDGKELAEGEKEWWGKQAQRDKEWWEREKDWWGKQAEREKNWWGNQAQREKERAEDQLPP